MSAIRSMVDLNQFINFMLRWEKSLNFLRSEGSVNRNMSPKSSLYGGHVYEYSHNVTLSVNVYG